MSEDFEREERAFAEALHASVPVETFRPLDAEAIKAAARPARPARARWMRGVAAAAVLVVTVGAGAALLPRMAGTAGSVHAEPAAGSAAGGAVPEAAPPDGDGYTVTATDATSVAEWVAVSGSPLSPRMRAAGAWLDGKFYVVGGVGSCTPAGKYCIDGELNLADGASYDPSSDTWERLPDAPQAVQTNDAVVVGKRLYYGRTAGAVAVAPMAFDTTTSQWLEIPAPAQPGQLVAAGDRLVSIGNPDGAVAIDQVFDPVEGTWSALPKGSFGNQEWRRGVYADGQLIVGGMASAVERAEYARFEAFDFASNTWRNLAASKVYSPFGERVGDYLVVGTYESIEGANGRTYVRGARYNLLTGEWSDLPKPAIPDSAVSVRDAFGQVVGNLVVIKGKLFNPADGTWQALTLPDSTQLLGATVIGSPDGLFVFGGSVPYKLSGKAYYLPLR